MRKTQVVGHKGIMLHWVKGKHNMAIFLREISNRTALIMTHAGSFVTCLRKEDGLT
jgi:hypothetical protein